MSAQERNIPPSFHADPAQELFLQFLNLLLQGTETSCLLEPNKDKYQAKFRELKFFKFYPELELYNYYS